MNHEEFKESIRQYFNNKRVVYIHHSFFVKNYPNMDYQLALDEMIEDKEIIKHTAYKCPNCLQTNPKNYVTEKWDDNLLFYVCLLCGSEYELDECVYVDEVVYYSKVEK